MADTIGEMEHGGLTGSCYREFEPHPALAGKVRAFFSFTPTAEPISPTRRVTLDVRFGSAERLPPSFADASPSIVFELGVVLDASGTWRSAPTSATMIGPMQRAVEPNMTHGVPAMLGAYFTAAQLSAFMHLPASESTDQMVALNELWGSASEELGSALPAMTEAQRIDHMEGELLRRMSRVPERSSFVDVASIARHVSQKKGRVSVEELAADAGVSRQHLTRVFTERVGVSPKMYCRLARFHSALKFARAGEQADWAGVAFELGYADQSHMIAEFREFSSLTPHALATERWFHPFIERA